MANDVKRYNLECSGLGSRITDAHPDGKWVLYDDHAARVAKLERELEIAKENWRDLESSFELRYKADMTAIDRWRKAHPESKRETPERTDLLVWLIEQLDAAEKSEKAARVRKLERRGDVAELALELACAELNAQTGFCFCTDDAKECNCHLGIVDQYKAKAAEELAPAGKDRSGVDDAFSGMAEDAGYQAEAKRMAEE